MAEIFEIIESVLRIILTIPDILSSKSRAERKIERAKRKAARIEKKIKRHNN